MKVHGKISEPSALIKSSQEDQQNLSWYQPVTKSNIQMNKIIPPTFTDTRPRQMETHQIQGIDSVSCRMRQAIKSSKSNIAQILICHS